MAYNTLVELLRNGLAGLQCLHLLGTMKDLANELMCVNSRSADLVHEDASVMDGGADCLHGRADSRHERAPQVHERTRWEHGPARSAQG